jgi:dihydroorotate dehydrogenase electron transfer subunit
LPVRAIAEVLENLEIGPASHRLVLRIPDWPGAEPGQFVMISAGARTEVERTDPLLPRPMAVYRGHVPGGERVEILYRSTGRGTRLMAEALPGQSMRVVGPLGEGFAEIADGARALLVGGGTGIASLYELAARAAGRADVRVLLGSRSEADLMGQADFAALGVPLEITTEDGSLGTRGLVTVALERLLAENADATVYACGPTPMMRACAELAKRADARCVVSLENNMACGYGVCLGCAVPRAEGGFSLICRQGPVYGADEIAWEGLP